MNLHYPVLLVENKSIILENLKQAKQYLTSGKISQEDFNDIVQADPTPQKKYAGWMAKIFIQDRIDINNLSNKVAEFHTFLEKNKTKTRDINSFKSFQDLKFEIDNLNNSGEGLSQKDLESDYETIINNSDLLIISPHTHEASRKLGLTQFAFRDCDDGNKDSSWCTTYKAPDHFDKYYYRNNVTFYYVKVKNEDIIKKLQEEFPKNWKSMIVVALMVLKNGKFDGYDGLDKKIPQDNITKYINILGIS
jgi:hypothetical protein